jgi:peroxiredoxin
MRSLVCVLALVGLTIGCSKADYEEVSIPKIDSGESDATANVVETAAPPQELKVGDQAPTFANLVGVDDKKHSMDDFKGNKALVVVFTCNKCPVAVNYEDRLIAFQKDYADKGVQLVAINVNNAEADKLPAMKVRAEEKGFSFPYLYDPTQKVGRDYGAEVTPHVFLLDAERKLVFVGPMDDNPDEKQVTKTFLRDATDAVLEGKAVATTEVEPVGCGIQYE